MTEAWEHLLGVFEEELDPLSKSSITFALWTFAFKAKPSVSTSK